MNYHYEDEDAPRMTPLAHIREAERLLTVAASRPGGTSPGTIGLAQAHAQIAVAIQNVELAELRIAAAKKSLAVTGG